MEKVTIGDLPIELQNKAFQYAENQGKEIFGTDNLETAFAWNKTPEGFDYWAEVNKDTKEIINSPKYITYSIKRDPITRKMLNFEELLQSLREHPRARRSKTYLHTDQATEADKKHVDSLFEGGGLRFNTGKPRHDLVHPEALEGMVKVLTAGSEKYGDNNWQKGMPWTTVLASLKRHIAAFEKGEDFDPETGMLHADHIQCNAHFLSAYYKIFPQGDNRQHTYLQERKIGLDIDEVLADWVGAWMEKYGITERPTAWSFDREIGERFDAMRASGELDEFYLNLKPLIDPKELPFEPHCYITSRPVSTEVTQQWLDKMGFPSAPVYTVPCGKSKVEAAKEAGVTHFVDDSFNNFRDLNSYGIFCYLMDAPHNQRYDVGHRRLHSLKDL